MQINRRSVPLFQLIALLASSSALVLSYSVLTKTLTTSGTIVVPPSQTSVNLGFYSDKNCTVSVTSIDWGVLSPGSSKTVTTYLRNEGNVGLTLSINMTNVNPPGVSKHLSLTTNYGGGTISPNQILELTLTLNVTADAQGTDFGFGLVISYGWRLEGGA